MKFTIPALAAALVLAAPAALAQDATPPQQPKFDFAAHHAEMCNNLYAHAVGKFAELEVRLKLTSVQKPLFERWKNVKLTDAKARASECSTQQPPARDASIVDIRKTQIARLETRLSTLKAETPSFEALAKSLDTDQIKTLQHSAHEGQMMRARFAERFMDHRGPMGPGMRGPRGPMQHHAMMDGPADRGAMGADD